jgi:hypothetical protein
MEKNLNTFYEQMEEDLFTFGNHHFYKIAVDTFEERGNELLKRSNKYLNENPNLEFDVKIKIKCRQFWLVGFMTALKLEIKLENSISFKL